MTEPIVFSRSQSKTTTLNTEARPRRFDGFDGLRAIAALLVVLHHASFPSGRMYVGHFAKQLTQLDVGVAIFFLISGFLLYRPFAERILTGVAEPPVGKYLARRAARIFPAYWLALTVIIVVGKISHGKLLGFSEYPASRLGYLPYYGLVHIYRNFKEASGGLNQAWTLAVEITFYAFLPMFAWLSRRLLHKRSVVARYRFQLVLLFVMALLSMSFRAFAYWGHVSRINALGEYWLVANLDLFALGMGVAVLSVAYDHGLGPRRLIDRCADFGELWWVIAIVVFWIGANPLRAGLGTGANTAGVIVDMRPKYWHGLYKQELHGFVALCLLMPVAFTHRRVTLITRLLRQRLMIFLGVVSYGIYLWHQSAIVQATKWQYRGVFQADMLLLVVFGVAMATALATLSWFGFERPITRWVAARTRSNRAAA